MAKSAAKERSVFYTMKGGECGRGDMLLQAKVPIWFQTLLMEIPHIPSRSGFECRATGLQVPLPPLGRAGMAGNC